MTLNRFALTAALLATASLASASAFAQERDARKREAARSAQESSAKAERAQPKRESAAREEPRRSDQSVREEKRRSDQNVGDDRRRDDRSVGDQRRREDVVVGRAVPRVDTRRDDRGLRDEKRIEADRRENNGRYNGYNDRDRRYGNSSRSYYSRNYLPRTYYRPYTFRPHLSIGFGIFAGYPVPYAWRYSSPVYVYGYRAPRTPVYITPGAAPYGGVALEIGPYDADVFVDGNFAGKVEDFDGTSQPLTLVAGTHRIEVQAPGYAPLVFDVTVQPGQVIPYRGELRPY